METPSGKRRIDDIREGEFVWAFDFASGQWVARVVQACHRSQYLGAVVEIQTEHGSVEATAYHPFWVLDGYDLEHRPRPRELAEKEDEGLAVQGRWVNSHDLFAGDLLLTQDGRQLRVLAITQRFEESFAVCNLTIDTNHSFAVGNDGLLVHNTGGCGNFGINGQNGIPRLGIDVGEYRVVGGHHVHAKAGFKGHGTYDLNQGFSISQDYMRSRGWDHQAMTNKQRELFGDLARSGRANSLAEHTKIAEEALVAGGATRSEAQALVQESLQDLFRQGIIAPTRIPWQR